jgi:lauroyl/myristoyl acyltransferase
LALRSGAPLLPTAVYSKPRDGVSGVVRPALDTSRTEEGLRRDVVRATQQLATTFEAFIAAAPEQWHLMQPNWPSDHEALAAFRASRAEAADAARRGRPRRAAGRRPWRRETSPDRGPRGS